MPNVQMPRLSDSMETGKVVRWLKKEGEDVKKGEPLVEIESDKANIEVEAYASGKLSKMVSTQPTPAAAAVAPPPAQQAAPESGGGEQYPTGGPDDRTEAGAAAQAALSVIRRPGQQADGERLRVSPVARRIADELGVDLARVEVFRSLAELLTALARGPGRS